METRRFSKETSKGFWFLILAALGCAYISPAQAHGHAQKTFSAAEISDGVYMLQGQGGNLGLLTGEEGALLIDDDFDRNSDALMHSLNDIAGGMPKFLLNTHFHGDHTGGNQKLGEAGSLIVAHDNVRARLASGNKVEEFNMVSPPASDSALPVITYQEGISLYLNGNHIQVIHVPNAHTDSDSIVLLKEANVIHMGDTMFNGFFPFIDIKNGGSLSGVIAALGLVVELSDENTKVIPGHGPLASRADVISTKETLETVYERLSKLRSEGKSAEEAIAEKPLADIDARWGGAMFSADQWIGFIYNGLD